MELGLKGKVALVTGSGRGIGKQIALALAREGVSIAVNDINTSDADKTVEDVSKLKVKSKAYYIDVTNYSNVETMINDIVEEFGTLNILVNNAGISLPAPIQEMTIEQWKQVVDVNLNGVFYCSKAVFPIMMKEKMGRIINIASFAAKRGTLFGNNTSYASTKAAVMGLTVSLAVEAARYGITVNAIAPGVVETDLLKSVHSEEKRKEIAAYTLLKRLSSPEEIAELAVFLASDVSAYITGETVDINGGLLLDL